MPIAAKKVRKDLKALSFSGSFFFLFFLSFFLSFYFFVILCIFSKIYMYVGYESNMFRKKKNNYNNNNNNNHNDNKCNYFVNTCTLSNIIPLTY